MHFPAADRGRAKGHPWIMVCPGGAYINVCSISEGYPVAKKFNELGYDVFVATYRTGLYDVMPKPLDDLAACIRYVRGHRERFGVNGERYIVCGFSAGGNLTALWGTKNHGVRGLRTAGARGAVSHLSSNGSASVSGNCSGDH